MRSLYYVVFHNCYGYEISPVEALKLLQVKFHIMRKLGILLKLGNVIFGVGG